MNKDKARMKAMKAIAGVGESGQAERVNEKYTGLLAGFVKTKQEFEGMEKAIRRFRRLLDKHTTPLR